MTVKGIIYLSLEKRVNDCMDSFLPLSQCFDQPLFYICLSILRKRLAVGGVLEDANLYCVYGSDRDCNHISQILLLKRHIMISSIAAIIIFIKDCGTKSQ